MKKLIKDYFDKIYCINLDKDKEKLVYFDHQISKSNLIDSYDRFIAINGSEINLSNINDSIITSSARDSILSKTQKIFGISLTFGSLGCALSHKKIFEECSNSQKSFLIFEDDIILENQFDYILPNILQENIEYDIIYLGYNEIPGFNKKFINNNISIPSGLITGLYGYILSPNGAKNLLSTIFPLNKQIDSSISNNNKKLKLYCSTTRIIGVTQKFGSKTQRAASCKNIHRKIDDNWYKLFK